MATNTANFNLTLPEENDFYDINVENENARKIDLALAENRQYIINHENETDKHLTSAQSEKIDNAIPKVQEFTPGNFAKINDDGTISDSGLNEANFDNTGHNTKSVFSENGVHNFRYHNEKVQFFDGEKWIDVTSKTTIQVKIKCDIGATITATDGIETVTAIAESENITMVIPNFGSWEFNARLGEEISDTVTLNIDTVTIYNIDLVIINAILSIRFSDKSTENYLRLKKLNTGETTDIYLNPNNYRLDNSFYYYDYEFENEGRYEITIFKRKSYSDCMSETLTLDVPSKFAYTHIPKFAHTLVITEVNYPTTKKGEIYRINTDYTRTYIGEILYTGTSFTFLTPTNDNYEIKFYNDRGQYQNCITNSNNYDNATETEKIDFDPIYGVRIKFSESDPSKAVEYIDDAVGMTPGSTDWDNTQLFDDIEPWALDNNFNQLENLAYNDFTKNKLGNSVSSDYNVFISFPILQYKIEKDAGGLTIRLTTYQYGYEWEGYKPFTDKRFLYIAAYTAPSNYNLGKVSVRASKPVIKTSFNSFNSIPSSNIRDGVKIMPYRIWLMLQCLFVIRYKSLNSQAALGNGYVEASDFVGNGNLPFKGMYYGGNDGVKFCGLEHLWGNAKQLISGLYAESGSDFNDNNVKITGVFVDEARTIYHTENYGFPIVGHSAEFPFITADRSDTHLPGSSSTYMCDFQSITDGGTTSERVARVGGYYNDKQNAGIFNIDFALTKDDAESSTTTRYILEYD